MSYPNLEAELARAGIKQKEVANLLKRNPATINTWLRGEEAEEERGEEDGKRKGGGFTVEDCKKLRDKFFPGMSLDYLFADKPIVGNC